MDGLAECRECERDSMDALAEAGCTHVDCPKRVVSLCPACKDTPMDRCARMCRGEGRASEACTDCRVSSSRCVVCVRDTVNERGLGGDCAWVQGLF